MDCASSGGDSNLDVFVSNADQREWLYDEIDVLDEPQCRHEILLNLLSIDGALLASGQLDEEGDFLSLNFDSMGWNGVAAPTLVVDNITIRTGAIRDSHGVYLGPGQTIGGVDFGDATTV